MARQARCRLKQPGILAMQMGQGEALVGFGRPGRGLHIVLPRYAIARARLAVHWHDAKAAIFCYVFVPFYLNVRGGVGLYTSCCDFGVVLASV